MNGELEGSKRQTFRKVKPERARHNGTCWNGGVMVSMKKMMLGAALAVGAVAMTAAPANAAVRFGVAIGGPVAYVPPSPGPGYAWVNGYWAGGAWVPGYWNAPAVGFGVRIGGPVYHFDHGPYYRGYDHGRGYDHFRGYDHGYRR